MTHVRKLKMVSARSPPLFTQGTLEPNIRSMNLWTCWLVHYDTILCHSACTNSGFPTNILDVVKTGQHESMHIMEGTQRLRNHSCQHYYFDWLVTRIHVFGDTYCLNIIGGFAVLLEFILLPLLAFCHWIAESEPFRRNSRWFYVH